MASFSFETAEDTSTLEALVDSFAKQMEPIEGSELLLLKDDCTGAIYTECHILGSMIKEFGTDDVPLDPESSGEYRANRNLVDDHAAFTQMQNDALNGRSFSNLVCEFVETEGLPLRIIGGQHRFNAILGALDESVDQLHGLKVYFDLDNDQRLDVQVISNTNITVSKDLLDRMYETIAGSELREWAQSVGLLSKGEDFADKRKRGSPISVQFTRTFIVNYYAGKSINPDEFAKTPTTPVTVRSGQATPKEWSDVKKAHPELWDDKYLKKAAKEYASLKKAQEDAFLDKSTGKPQSGTADFRDKASNLAILSAWSFTAGLLQTNSTRLARHYALKSVTKQDPLKAAILAQARHSTDAENYRGLGYRTDPQERGRMVELFWLQAEKGNGITKKMVEVALEAFHAKQANLKLKKLSEAL